jgi:D-alanyl-lipoteichoic acid acyltransferase DltB (MBOAT superfamily)
MGFHFNINFNSPYQSKNITEFWRRWHISLSTWLKDYLYISLGGNQKGKIRTYFNLFITMVLGGLWHGAGLRFILWGALHGMALVIHKLYLQIFPVKQASKYKVIRWISSLTGIIITFNFVCFCWIFFRAEDMKVAAQILNQIAFHFNYKILLDFIMGYKLVLILMLVGYILHFVTSSFKNSIQDTIIGLPLLFKIFILIIVIMIVVQFKSADIQPFIYFQF